MNHYQIEAPRQPLTKRQVSILNFMDEYRRQNGYAPSIREIGTGTGIASTSAVNYQINRLVAGGYLDRTNDVSRSYVLLASAYQAIEKQRPDECEFANLRAEIKALQAEKRRLREQYEAHIRGLEQECNQLTQTLAALKHRVTAEFEDVLDHREIAERLHDMY